MGRAAGLLSMSNVNVSQVKPYADSAAHNAIPDDFLWCLVTRRHLIGPPPREIKVRVAHYGGTLDVFESTAPCGLCGTVRTMWRDQRDESLVSATYVYPDGYQPPEGTVWDREYLRAVWRERHPVKGRTQDRTR